MKNVKKMTFTEFVKKMKEKYGITVSELFKHQT